MKKSVFIIFTCLSTVALGDPFPVPYATEMTQIANNMELVTSVAQQAEQLANELNMYQNMVTNLANIPSQVWTSVQKDLDSVANVVQQGEAISFAQQNIATAFQAKYPGYTQANDFTKSYQSWSASALDGLNEALQAAGLQSQQFTTEEAALNQLRSMSQSSVGRMQAIQVGNQIAVEQVAQTQKLRELVMAQTQSQSNYLAAEKSEKDAQQAEVEQLLKYKDLPTVDYKYFNGSAE
jgi:type IV secretion system protein TrbJ